MAHTEYHLQIFNTMSPSPPKHTMHFFCFFPDVFINNENSQPIMRIVCDYVCEHGKQHSCIRLLFLSSQIMLLLFWKWKCSKSPSWRRKKSGIFASRMMDEQHQTQLRAGTQCQTMCDNGERLTSGRMYHEGTPKRRVRSNILSELPNGIGIFPLYRTIYTRAIERIDTDQSKVKQTRSQTAL